MHKLLLALLAFSVNIMADQYEREVGVDPATGRSRLNDWNYQQGWRYDKKDYLKGDTQPQAYQQNHPNGQGGIGYDP